MNLLIYGAGHLGARVASLMVSPANRVVAVTATAARHGVLRQIGVEPFTIDSSLNEKFDFVLFSVPPSKTDDYAGVARKALDFWNREGLFLMTSSTAVYCETNGGEVKEDSAVWSGRENRIREAEEIVLAEGASVVRLAGLYDYERGAHRYYLRNKKLDSFGGEWINQIHIDDAANLCASIMAQKAQGIFLGSDGTPMTREQIAAAAFEAYARKGEAVERCIFSSLSGKSGKRINPQWTWGRLNWKPRYASFMAWANEL